VALCETGIFTNLSESIRRERSSFLGGYAGFDPDLFFGIFASMIKLASTQAQEKRSPKRV
jgi:hypothetical protein